MDLLPIVCFTCGGYISAKKKAFDEELRKGDVKPATMPMEYLQRNHSLNNPVKKALDKVLDDPDSDRICCRTILLTSIAAPSSA
jgi:DNA-directed RNA polymerase subunit N (RpoN/RPB10)